MDGGAMFGVVPRLLWEPRLPPDAQHRVPLALHCLLIRDGATTILVDTGFGTKLGVRPKEMFGLEAWQSGLFGDLAQAGVAASDIDIVVNTHLHWDHCGGNTIEHEGAIVPTFPNATYVCQRVEWGDAQYPDERTRATYHTVNFVPVADRSRLELIDGDTRVAPHVRTLFAPGHTRSHQCVVVEPTGAAPIAFLADLAPHHSHLERVAWVPAVDIEPQVSLNTKRNVARWLVESGATVVLQHDGDTPVGHLAADGRHFRWLPVSAGAVG